jgi:hypothetical protein
MWVNNKPKSHLHKSVKNKEESTMFTKGLMMNSTRIQQLNKKQILRWSTIHPRKFRWIALIQKRRRCKTLETWLIWLHSKKLSSTVINSHQEPATWVKRNYLLIILRNSLKMHQTPIDLRTTQKVYLKSKQLMRWLKINRVLTIRFLIRL